MKEICIKSESGVATTWSKEAQFVSKSTVFPKLKLRQLKFFIIPNKPFTESELIIENKLDIKNYHTFST